jgi:hypothetical protein
VKNTSKAVVAGALLGALLLGGCAADASEATPAATETATPSPTAAATAAAVELPMPEAKGIEATPVIVDPNMAALHPEAAAEVQAALKTFLDASRSFPELQKGSRPVLPEDAAILEPVMTEEMWAHTLDYLQDDNPLTFPAWLEPGNPFDAQYDDDVKALDESLRATFTPDENGMTYVHSAIQPITVRAWLYDDGRQGVQLKDVHFRVFYRNIEGGIGALERKINYNFDQQEDGSWDVAYWDKKGGWGSATTQEHITALMDF